MSKGIQIGVVGRRTGLSVDAIRFYEKQGLLRPPPRSNGGFRLFHEEDVRDLEFIRGAQTLGFSLEEIRALISLRAATPEPCAEVERLLAMKLGLIREKIGRLKALESELLVALRNCRQASRQRRPHSAASCPVLAEIAKGRRSENKR
jgi:DNA-binding transcriptional MerR regulator